MMLAILIFGEKVAKYRSTGASDGGYMFPASFVQMVERQRLGIYLTRDATPIEQGIGSIIQIKCWWRSFAILEDRKFKSAPIGNIPEMGPAQTASLTSYRAAVDLPGLSARGRTDFLNAWARDWNGIS